MPYALRRKRSHRHEARLRDVIDSRARYQKPVSIMATPTAPDSTRILVLTRMQNIRAQVASISFTCCLSVFLSIIVLTLVRGVMPGLLRIGPHTPRKRKKKPQIPTRAGNAYVVGADRFDVFRVLRNTHAHGTCRRNAS